MPDSSPSKTVDLWRVDLNYVAPCEYSLSHDERERTQRFRRAVDAQRFIAARTALRQILAKYLRTAPHEIVFSYNACGKPLLESSEWHFNLSHCEKRALIAVARSAVGVDIEKVDEARARRMKKFLSPEDVAGNLTTREICERWVKMESLIKARGAGMSVPLPPLRVIECGYAVQLLDSNNCVAAVALASENAFHLRCCDYALEFGV